MTNSELDLHTVPILYYKNSRPGEFPFDMPERFASGFEAAYISKMACKIALVNKRLEKGMPSKAAANLPSRAAERAVRSQAKRLLNDSYDVVVDAGYNSPKKRESIQEIAAKAGAITVALQAETSPHIAVARLEEWMENVELPVPREYWKDSALYSKVTPNFAAQPGEADYIISVNGDHTTEEIIGDIEDKLVYWGLADSSY